jgi:hypothetical protein
MTPDTLNYLILGLAAVAVIMGLLIASFFVRHRNLEQDMALIDQLYEDER